MFKKMFYWGIVLSICGSFLFGQTGNINIKVENVGGSAVYGAKVKRYTSGWSYIDYKTTSSSGYTYWNNISTGTYNFEAYYTGTFFGEEFWASDYGVVNSGSTTTKIIRRNYPYASNVVIKNVSTNQEISAGDYIEPGTQVHAIVTVQNDIPSTNLYCQVRFIFDRSRSSSYDYDSNLSSKKLVYGNGNTKTFDFYYTVNNEGQYYFALEVKTTLANSNVARTDSWTWTETFNVGINKPDLTPYKLSTWDDTLVISNETGTVTSTSEFYDDDIIYIDYACANFGNTEAENFKVGIYVNEILTKYLNKSSLSPNYYSRVEDSEFGPLSAGTYKFEIRVDFENSVNESNENNNTYSKYIVINKRNPPANIDVSPINITIRENDSNFSSRYLFNSDTELKEIPNQSIKYDIFDLKNVYVNSHGDTICKNSIKGKPPEEYDKNAALLTSELLTGSLISNVPAYNWSFGCSPTSAAMLIGYFDNLSEYSNLYTGPLNNGIAPMDNSIWQDVVISGETRHQCPISASRCGLNNRTSRGHVDNYWIAENNTDNDPYIQNEWQEHDYGDCVADFMKTSQSKYDNEDGETSFWNYINGSPNYDANLSTKPDDGCHGMRLFFEARGYNVLENYNQYIYGYNDNLIGFTYEQYKQEIDNNNPILIHVEDHTMLGVGYDSPNIIYIHNTWDYSTYSMEWGGEYEEMQHYAVSVIHIEGNSLGNNISIFNTGGEILTVNSISNSAPNWLNIEYRSTPFEIEPGMLENMNISVSNWDAVTSPESIGKITINSNDLDESNIIVRITAIPQNNSSVQNIVYKYELKDNFPNPFNPITTICYELQENSNIDLSIYDINGRKITTLINGNMTAGYHETNWDASGNTSGIYFYRLTTGDFIETKKMVLMK